jgi:hypothetical protein
LVVNNVAEEPEILDEEESLSIATEEGSILLARKLAVLKDRCEAAKIEYMQDKDEEGNLYARIYDIRCKIVHTKNEHSDDDLRMILPFSEDAEYLLHDIDLAEFVARSVLVSSSGELS